MVRSVDTLMRVFTENLLSFTITLTICFFLASWNLLTLQTGLRSIDNKNLIIANKKIYTDSIREYIKENCRKADVVEAASAEEALEKYTNSHRTSFFCLLVLVRISK